MKKQWLFALLSILFFIPAQAQNTRLNQSYLDYISTYYPMAIEQMNKFGIPASITLAQGLLESGAGNSELTRKGNNHFGIKCGSGWKGPKTYHDDDAENECFRKYKNAYESYEDHSLFLTRSPRYATLFTLKETDYKGWAKGLKRCGYATNPVYAEKLIGIIEDYKLYRYDTTDKVREFEHTVYMNNGIYYVRARRGDTFKSVAQDMKANWKKLAKYNERNADDTLEEGEIVYLGSKNKKADKIYDGYLHTIKAGESMYDIAQFYGIRLKNLYKMNHLKPDYQITVGDQLRVR